MLMEENIWLKDASSLYTWRMKVIGVENGSHAYFAYRGYCPDLPLAIFPCWQEDRRSTARIIDDLLLTPRE